MFQSVCDGWWNKGGREITWRVTISEENEPLPWADSCTYIKHNFPFFPQPLRLIASLELGRAEWLLMISRDWRDARVGLLADDRRMPWKIWRDRQTTTKTRQQNKPLQQFKVTAVEGGWTWFNSMRFQMKRLFWKRQSLTWPVRPHSSPLWQCTSDYFQQWAGNLKRAQWTGKSASSACWTRVVWLQHDRNVNVVVRFTWSVSCREKRRRPCCCRQMFLNDVGLWVKPNKNKRAVPAKHLRIKK